MLIDSSLLEGCLFLLSPFEGEGAEQIGQAMHFSLHL